MKKIIFIIISISLVYISFANNNKFSKILDGGIRDFEGAIEDNLVVSFGNFTYSDTNIGSEFSQFIIAQLEIEFDRSSKFKIFAKNELEDILEAINLGLDDITDENTNVEAGKLEGIQGLFVGKFFDEKRFIKLFIDLIDIEKGIKIKKILVNIPKNKIPKNIKITPENFTKASKTQNEISSIGLYNKTNLNIKVWTKKGNGGIYKKNEKMVVNFLSDKDCYIKIYHIDVNNKISLIFPNEYHSDNYIKANKTYIIPDEDYKFDFILGAPYGTEFIKVIASTTQFKDIENAFLELGIASKKIVNRGLTVKQKKGDIAEEMINFTIIK